jgi:hypothetical protein
MESSLQELEQRTLVRPLTLEQSEDYDRKQVDSLRNPVYGEPARETRKGKTYVSKLKEEDIRR